MTDERRNSEKLREVKALLDHPRHWVKGMLSAQYILSDGEQAFCLLGAAGQVETGDAQQGYATSIGSLIGSYITDSVMDQLIDKVWSFNDAPWTTHEKVLALLDRAIAGEEEKEKLGDTDQPANPVTT